MSAPAAWPLWLACALGAAAAAAQTPVSLCQIGAGALARDSGRLALNLGAGSGNAQANLAVLGLAGDALALGARSRQQLAPSLAGGPGVALAAIDAGAFAGAGGLIALNQVAGTGNGQVNLALVGIARVAELSVDQLGASALPADPAAPAGAAAPPRASIADSAFVGARGIVQVSQLAGSGNSTANIFALGVSVGAR